MEMKDKKYEPINYHGKTFYPPYHLFQNEEGLWGLKDSKDEIYYRPVYKRSEKEGSENVFVHIDHSEVVEFDEEEGFALLAYCSEPFREMAWAVANYPDEYHDMIWKRLKDGSNKSVTDIETLKSVQSKFKLTSKQTTLLDMLMCNMKYRFDMTDEEWETNEQRLLELKKEMPTAQERVDVLVALIKENNLSDSETETLLYHLLDMNDMLIGY